MSCSPESWSGVRRGPLLALLAVVLVSVTAAEDSAANATLRQSRSRGDSSLGFLECLSAVRGRSSAASLLSRLDSDESRDSFMGRAIGCVKVPILRSLRAVRESHGADLQLWNGAVVLHRLHGDAADAPPPGDDGEAQRARSLAGTDEELLAYHDIIEELNRVSKAYVMEVEVYPGVRAQLNRDQHRDDGVNLSFKLDGLAEVAKRQLREDDDDDDDGDVDVVDEDESEQGRDITDYIMEDRHGHKKKKVLKGLKKLRKKLAPYLPLLAIPLAIQMMMLPLYIMALKMMALKSILLGKMTLMLVAFNILRNVQQRQLEDSHNSRVAAEYYGYSDDGIEYGGWVNRRRAFSGRSADRQQRSSRRRR